MGLWRSKIPVEAVNLKDEELSAMADRIAPIAGEWVTLKKRASAFSGITLAGYLRAAGVGMILVTGVTATACVRPTNQGLRASAMSYRVSGAWTAGSNSPTANSA
ncbi:MAG: isochorismatase family protein [Pseudomonadota bacterium]